MLQQFVDDELSHAPTLIERCLAGTLTVLRDTRGSASERAHHLVLIETLQRQSATYQSSFIDALRRRVQQELAQQEQQQLQQQQTASGTGPDAALGLGGLELMDESRVEADIEVSRAMQIIDSTAEWELRELQTFTSTLVGQTYVSAESNPFRPLVYASALWDAACAITPTPAQRATLLRVSAGVAAGLLKSAWAAASTRLEAKGIEPGVYRTVLLAPGSVPGRGTSPIPAAAAQPPSQALSAIATLLASLPAAPPAPQRVASGGATAGSRVLDLDLDLDLGDPSAGAGAGERPVIELLTRLFDTLLADPQLPTSFHAPLARLQVPALRLALRDRELLEATSHPLWMLVDRIGQSAIARPHAADTRAQALVDQCNALADELARAGTPDAIACRRALDRLDGFLAAELRAQQAAARPSIDNLALAERREKLEQNLTQRLADQLAPLKIPPLIRRFMTGTWAQVVAEAMLRFGDQAEETRGYVKLVDELAWSLQLPDHPQSRQRLLALLPSLLQRLRTGMALVALAPGEQQAVLDELMIIHTEALRPGTGRGGPAELTPAQIVQRMRDEVVPEALASASQTFSDSVIDLASMETVPAELMPVDSGSGTRADDPAQRVDALRVADYARLFLQGQWQRVQLLWRSDQGSFFVFAGETTGRTHSITRRALERLAGAGLLQPLQTGALLQRAIDTLSREIAPIAAERRPG
ncbi:MAG TPA: DUF1631 family protein [Burkholderiaceae bacterium]